ncbi:MAG: 6-phosphofructokinase [Hyphomicrobiales bacterium]
MNNSVAILCGGGPAPGINSVISSVAKVFLKSGFRVLGIQKGYSTIFTKEPLFSEIDFTIADQINKMGGSALQMSRYKPKDEEFTTDFFEENNVKLLVTIGGDDTASTANRISRFLKSKSLEVQNVHVPKTIDNDLPLPEGVPTFGYQSAKQAGVQIAQTVYEDARTSGNWFVGVAMGREAGHLAFGIGAACHYPMIVIPEMFNKTTLTFDKICNLLISAIVKRKILGIDYGVSIISEGIFHFIDDEQIINAGINFTYDDHGHPELGTLSKAHIFNIMLQKRLQKLGLNVKSRPIEIGYAVRCVEPIAFDLLYCSLLGYGVKKLFDQGESGCMVTIDQLGNILPLYLDDVAKEGGIIETRLVNIESERVRLIFDEGLQYIAPEDYEEASKFVENPETYDFRKILNW